MNSRKRAKMWPRQRHRDFVRQLRKAARDWFIAKAYEVHPKMPYCLAHWEDWPRNIILPEVAEYVKQESSAAQDAGVPFPLHKYIHHGLSSQALAFNLIGPMITRENYAPLTRILLSKGVPIDTISSARFEQEDRNVFMEETGQPTSIDIVLSDSTGNPCVFVESKLTEPEFGGCSLFARGDCTGKNPVGREDECLLHFIGRQYWVLMEKYGISEALRNEWQCVFIAHYQFFRELLFALEKGGVFVLLHDERSPVFSSSVNGQADGLIPFLKEILPSNCRDKVATVTVQEVLKAVEASVDQSDWTVGFRAKYGLD